jgi:hypothetical protein
MGRGDSVFYEEQGVQYEEDGSDEEVDDEGRIELIDESERAEEGTHAAPSPPFCFKHLLIVVWSPLVIAVELTSEEPLPSGEEAASS